MSHAVCEDSHQPTMSVVDRSLLSRVLVAKARRDKSPVGAVILCGCRRTTSIQAQTSETHC